MYNAAGGYLSIFTGLKGFCATIANGTQAGLQSVICACDELRSGAVDAVLAAGTDENSENITEVYSHLPLPGHVVGEGCVTMLLEDAAAAQARGARIYAEILGYAGTHQAARYGSEPAQEQVDRTLAGALQDAGLTARRPSVHCTGDEGPHRATPARPPLLWRWQRPAAPCRPASAARLLRWPPAGPAASAA